jgi:hypothetical protein
MSDVFQNIDPPPPHRPAIGGGGHTRWVERGWEVNILEDARHSSVLYISTLCTQPINMFFLTVTYYIRASTKTLFITSLIYFESQTS